jgi:hypothetical protein
MRPVDPDSFRSWLDRYFGAWASNDPAEVAGLFAEHAEYASGPFRAPTLGREAIVRAWVGGDAPPELRFAFEPLAVEGATGIAHWSVSYAREDGGRVELDGILVCDFDADGVCARHCEWYDRRETNGGPT